MPREVWVPLEKANTGEVRLQLEVLGKDYDLAREADAVTARNAHVATVTKSEGKGLPVLLLSRPADAPLEFFWNFLSREVVADRWDDEAIPG